MSGLARLVAGAAVFLLLGSGCGSAPPREIPVLLVNAIYPEDTYDLAQPKIDDAVSCTLLSTDEATALIGIPVRSEGEQNCTYYSLDVSTPDALLYVDTSAQPLDEVSYVTLDYSRRTTIGGNSALILDFVTTGCAVEVALSAGRGGRTLSINAEPPITCAQVLAVAGKVLDRIPDDPAVAARVIPDLDRYRAVIDPFERGFPATDLDALPDNWVTTALDDPRHLHPGDAGPAYS